MDVRTFVNDALHEQLTEGRSLEVGYATHGLLHAHCACHSFCEFPLALLLEVMDTELADLEVWGRANYGAFIDE
jgi:hypothetical protein